MRKANAIIQCEKCWHRVTSLEVPCVLQIAFKAFRIKFVTGTKRVNHLQVTTRMRNVITRRITIFVFGRVLLDALKLIGHSSLNLMLASTMLHHQLQTLHVSVEIVTRMLHIRTHTEVFRRLCLCQPVLSLNVITLLLFRCESRCEER